MPPADAKARPRRVRRVVGLAAAAAVAAGIAGAVLGAGKEKSVAEGKSNRLIHEKSPYLLQHARNPVDWYPWGEEAFERARREDKPIFLSVGYSTCHWCHVMERESFENPDIAALLNDGFVSIKVDREERPDVDRVYMNAAFAMTGSGGWPLTVFLTPDGQPFYAGTYFPPEDRHGRAGLPRVLAGVRQAWQEQRSQVLRSAEQLTQAIDRSMRVEPDTSGVEVARLAELAARQLAERYDDVHGGFGPAPKFPQPSYLDFLLRHGSRHGDERAVAMALETLRKMARGGLHDHLGGGFHRYSVDGEWRVPHFEKMLYDQAQLAWAYLEAYQVSGDPFFAEVARDVLAYVARELTHPEGGFYSAEDADSPTPTGEKEEGAFYVWTVAEVEKLLGKERAQPFLHHYTFRPEGNFEHGNNVLHAPAPPAATAERFGLSEAALGQRLAEDRDRLFAARQRRPRPHLDDKVLTAWNGLMISAYARAYQVLGDAEYLERARRAADFVRAKNYDAKTGELRRRWRDGESAIAGELSDHAFFVQGLLDLYEAGFRIEDLEMALALTDRQVERFWNQSGAGFFDTAEGASQRLFVRTMETHDGAEPTGNSVATLNLARLAQMTGRADLEEKARASLQLFADHAARAPLALTRMWVAADFLAGKAQQVVIAGEPGAADTRALLEAVRRPFLPRKIVLLADGDQGQKWLAERLPFVRTIERARGRATAYVCENYVCRLPTTDPEQVARQLAPTRSQEIAR